MLDNLTSITEEYEKIPEKETKNISSDLLASFEWQLTREDISEVDKNILIN